MKKKEKRGGVIFNITASIVRIFYRKREILGLENLSEEPALIVGNHAQAHGPISCQLFFPTKKKIWCIGQMMHVKEVPSYAYKDFWMYKPKWIRWFFKILSYVIALPASYYLSRGDTLAVYKDARLLATYKETMVKLEEGNNIIIFPECHEDFNDIVNEFQDKFVDVAKLYYKKTGKALEFVPMYNAAKIKKIVLGKPIKYDPNIDINEQRKIICDYLKEEITRIAKELPRHKVIPFKNIKKKDYKYSK